MEISEPGPDIYDSSVPYGLLDVSDADGTFVRVRNWSSVGTSAGPLLRDWLLAQPPELQVRWDRAQERGELKISTQTASGYSWSDDGSVHRLHPHALVVSGPGMRAVLTIVDPNGD